MRKTRFVEIAAIACALAIPGTGPEARADECHLPWDIPCCFVCDTSVAIATVNLKICNCTDEPAPYNWRLVDPNGLLTFSPSQGTIMQLGPGECTNIPITICCPPGSPVGVPVVYFAEIINKNTGAVFGCEGSVVFTGDVKLEPCDPTLPTPTGVPTRGGFVATTLNPEGSQIFPTFEAMGGWNVQVSGPAQVDIPPGEAVLVPLEILVLSQSPVSGGAGVPTGQFADLLVSWDQDGDGTSEVGSSITFQVSTPCVGDLDGDGVVGSSDLALLLGGWGLCP